MQTIVNELMELLLEWKEKGVPADVIPRTDIDFTTLKNKANTFVGVRRSGKSYAMYQLAQKNPKNSFYINLEDDRIINPDLKHLTNIVPVIKENFDVQKIHLFVDEIQNINNWEKWAQRIIRDPNIVLTISGSSSKLSSREIATSLRGRSLTNYVFPLSFPEFLKFKNIKINDIRYSGTQIKLKKLLKEYLKFGACPEIVLTENEKTKIKIGSEYFETILAKDIIERYNIDNIIALESFMKYLINNFSRLISFSKAENWLKSIGIKISKATLIEYFNYIKSSSFMFETNIFSYKIKDALQYPRKVYVIDTIFPTILAIKTKDMNWFLENTVAVELFKMSNKDTAFKFAYWKSKQQEEVDFVLKQGSKIHQLIQVCYDINDEKVKNRELKALLKASKELKCRNLLVITFDYEARENHDNKIIKFLPLWKWLLNRLS